MLSLRHLLSLPIGPEYLGGVIDKRLTLALENLISRGELSQESAHRVETEFANLTPADDSRRKVISEVGGYLGGLFIVISLLILVNGRWHHISRFAQFALFMAMAVLLSGICVIIGKSTAARSRLFGLLSVVASICVTVAIITVRDHGNGMTTFAILVGWSLTLSSFIYNRTIFGELSLAGFSIAVGISGIFFISPHLVNNSYAMAVVLAAVGSIWLFFANKHFFNRTLGDALAMVMLFASGQFMFNGDFRFVTYLIYISLVLVVSRLYSSTSEWPLLVGAVGAITVGTGEFVGETLGGSLGAALGLLTSGIFFVTGSAYSFKRVKRRDTSPPVR